MRHVQNRLFAQQLNPMLKWKAFQLQSFLKAFCANLTKQFHVFYVCLGCV